MKININNYEEFFLMYADNELSAQDRMEVEDFIQQNPQYKDEFGLICDTILAPEDQPFPFKDELYKSDNRVGDIITEETLLLYIDNELTPEEMTSTEIAIASSDPLKKEAAILMNTRSIPDLSITYPNKFSLYKKEERNIPVLWYKWAAAAAVIMGFGWFSVGYFTTSKQITTAANSIAIKPAVTPQNQVIKQVNASSETSDPLKTGKPSTNKLPVNSTNNLDNTAQTVQTTDQHDEIIKSSIDNKQDKKPIIPVVDNKQFAKNSTENKPLSNDLPVPDPNYNNRKINTQSNITQPDNSVENNLASTSGEPITQSEYTIKPVSYIERDENNDDRERSIAGVQFHKSKLGIFLKRASRTVVRNLKVKDRDEQN